MFIRDQYNFEYSQEYLKGYAVYRRRGVIMFDFHWTDDMDFMFDMV